jgi:hypothetical protein
MPVGVPIRRMMIADSKLRTSSAAGNHVSFLTCLRICPSNLGDGGSAQHLNQRKVLIDDLHHLLTI